MPSAVDDRERAVPHAQHLPDEPERQQADGEHQWGDAAHGVGPQQGTEPPHPDEGRLVGRDLQALRGLEDDGAEGARGQEARGADDRGAGVGRTAAPPSQDLGGDDEPEPDRHHEQEPDEGRQLVEVRRDEPDQAQADEACSERQDDPREGEPAAGDVAGPDGLGRPPVDERVVLPAPQLGLQPLQLCRAGGPDRRVATAGSGGGGGGWRGHRELLGVKGHPAGCRSIVLPAPTGPP